MSYELTDEDIDNAWPNEPLHIIKNGEALWLELLRVAHVIAKAAQEKQRNYYLNMTPEKLGENIEWFIREGQFLEQYRQTPIAEYVLFLVIPHTIEKLLEKIGGIEKLDFNKVLNSWKYLIAHDEGKFSKQLSEHILKTILILEAIQAVLKVIKEVE